MPLSPESLSKIAEIRSKSLAGTLTKEDMRLAVELIREGRISAAKASDGAKRAKAKKEIPSADDLLDQLTGG